MYNIGLAVPPEVLIKDQRSNPRRQLADLAYFKKHNLIVTAAGQPIPSGGGTGDNFAEVYNIPLKEIHIIKALFQNRKADYSQESVNKIINAYNAGAFSWVNFDPVILWLNAGKYYILSGHSRFKACSDLSKIDNKFLTIPAKVFKGSQAEAEKIALESNTLSTKETDTERANFYRQKRAKGATAKELKELAKELEGKDARKIIALSYLSEQGDALAALVNLDRGDQQSKSILLTVCVWIGKAREQFNQLTTSHENELFKYLMSGGYGNKAGQLNNEVIFLQTVYNVINKNTVFGEFEKDKPLNLARTIYSDPIRQEYESILNDIIKQIKAATTARDAKRLELTQRGASQEQFNGIIKKYDMEIFNLTQRLAEHRKREASIIDAGRNQQQLFGINGLNTGIVKDSAGNALQFANVYESDASGAPLYTAGKVNGTQSNGQGLFTLNINKSFYYITAAYSGAAKQTLAVTAATNWLNFTLKITELPAVTVTASRKTAGGLLALIVGLLIYNS
jgi:hypothetical protein